jgi:molybdopterin/thiamine biosynthesis adenylyltransferase
MLFAVSMPEFTLNQGHPMQIDDLISHEFSRNIGLLSEDDMQKLLQSHVAIAGCGGVGGIHALTLARMGIGKFSLADLDEFERENISRQFGAYQSTVGRHKAEVIAEMIHDINPDSEVHLYKEGISTKNVTEFLQEADLYVDGMEFFEFDIRRLLFNTAREAGIYSLTSAPLGFGGTLQVFAPDGMTFDQYFGIREGMSYEEKIAAFAVGVAPWPYQKKYMDLSKVSFKEKKGPAVAPSCTLASALVAAEVAKIICQRGKVKPVPHYIQIDLMLRKFKTSRVWGGGNNPLQRIKAWFALRVIRKS